VVFYGTHTVLAVTSPTANKMFSRMAIGNIYESGIRLVLILVALATKSRRKGSSISRSGGV